MSDDRNIPSRDVIWDHQDYGKCHEWRRYVPEELQKRWRELSDETREAIFLTAYEQATREEWE